MKRFWLVLLSLGLVLAFSASAMAVDVKFSGSFYAAGMYQDKTTFRKDSGTDGPSTAFYYQRLRVQTEFVVASGLSLITRFDAMERAWGANRATTNIGTGNSDPLSSGTTAENENIAFDLAYIQYTSPIGMFLVGYQNDGAWGTQFGDSTAPLARITYITQFGPVTALGYIAKYVDNSVTSKNPTGTNVDTDIDMYVVAGIYNFKDGSAGLLGKYIRQAQGRLSTVPSLGLQQKIYVLEPYAKAKFGPVTIQAELDYAFGDYMKFDDLTGNDVRLDNLAGWVDVMADFGMVYVGGTIAYAAGDDPGTASVKEGGVLNGGTDWNPALIMFNYDRMYWAGSTPGWNSTQNPNPPGYTLAKNDGGMYNAWFFQGRVGVKPIAPLDIMASVSYANADKKPAGVLNNAYGWEIDVTGTYKITNNLSYMLGFGYFLTGDFYKGTSNAQSVNNDYLLINKLTLTF